ncbi:MAG: hypothetical protein V8T00_08595 [Oscillospiraceae bacterium]
MRKKLEKDREQAYLSYDLATIRKNAPVDFIPKRNLVREVNNDALYALFHRLEFTRLIARYGLTRRRRRRSRRRSRRSVRAKPSQTLRRRAKLLQGSQKSIT